jgi:transcriptional regulator with XRE-family HTH domain
MADKKTSGSRTSTLLRRLMRTSDLPAFIKKHEQEMDVQPFHEYITEICLRKELVPEQVIRKAGIERSYGHQLFNGTRKPSRDKVIQLAFGLGLDLDETQKMLQLAQKSPLYPKIKRDAAIVYCLTHDKDIMETQTMLHSLDLTLLGGD